MMSSLSPLCPLLFFLHHTVNPSIGCVPLSAHGDAHLSMEEFILAANHNRGVVNERRRANTSTTLMTDFCLSAVSRSLWAAGTFCVCLTRSVLIFTACPHCVCVCVCVRTPQLTTNKPQQGSESTDGSVQLSLTAHPCTSQFNNDPGHPEFLYYNREMSLNLRSFGQ